ncbi:sugar ABC transporter ATP-binding protein [Feifania hominis]|uniref:Sugar ABC transporter ATP-binding protein n=1 Tax=Feifania hominis TaxID=2763660 RepID=A0A926DFE5_9FIRM|nr:sugar ABC transporter ATP-binding protein [Feifania hominis]MBC8537148.1 sugar ABC transporter ATP-binding protein [Feifania hominis]
MNEVLLEMKGITKVFPGVKALDNVSLEVQKGEIHALIGENGAGKSTLMKILIGLYRRDGGSVIFKGREVNFESPCDALNAGISMIHQEISLVPTLTVAENIWLGREKKFTRRGLLKPGARNAAAKELLEQIGLSHLDPKAVVSNLSVANMQLVEIARAVSYHSDLIIMDEPTSALTNVEVELLYNIIRKLASGGTSVIFISHKLEELFEVCDRLTVFRDGKYITTKTTKEIDQSGLIQYIVGRELSALFPKLPAQIGDVVLEVRNLKRAGVVNDVSFSVRAGEILGFSGLVGSGRTEIVRAIFGIDKRDSGEIFINGQRLNIRDPRDAVRAGIGMITEDRLRMGSIHSLSVMRNTTIAKFDKIGNRLGFYCPSREKAEFDSITGKIDIKYSSPNEAMSQLSGGNQQKVIISRWLLTNSKVLILDEPTRGIDVGSKSEIHRLISSLAQQGIAIILISSELPEILGMCDRIAVIRGGRIAHVCDRSEATQENLMAYAFGTKHHKE